MKLTLIVGENVGVLREYSYAMEKQIAEISRIQNDQPLLDRKSVV